MKILLKYVNKLIDLGQIDEFHIWNFSKNDKDEEYLKSLIHDKYRLITPNNKNEWTEYYEYYKKYDDNDIIIKSDDDILFIDVDEFQNFIRERKNDKKTFLLFPSIINNGVCAWYQQKYDLLPKTLHDFKYETYRGDVVDDGNLGMRIHEYFLKNKENIIRRSKTLKKMEIKVGDRTSINFFAALVKDFKLLTKIHADEHELTIDWTRNLSRNNSIYMPFIVSHGSFGSQTRSGLDDIKLSKMYEERIFIN